jgi:hypoxanthine phosphoribosyltransferase
MERDVDRILIPQQRIAQRVREMARQITEDHSPPRMRDGGEITIVPILTGAMIFCCDLIRHIPIAMKIGLLTVSSYPGQSIRSQGSNVLAEQLGQITGRHVLLVDDILDSGGTLATVVPRVQALAPASVKTCVLLRKDRPEARQVPVDYVGFEIPDEFVVGYGLDYDDYYRNLPDIVTLKAEVIRGRSLGMTTTEGRRAAKVE